MHYRVLILSLTCNVPYFRKLTQVVKQTWAKDVLDGIIPDCEWFSYTACDGLHLKPQIDWDDHMIYVDCNDDKVHTYEKIQLAYKAITDAGITADYILHTNVSTYVNLDLLLPKIYECKHENDVIGIGFPWCHIDIATGKQTFRWCAVAGHCMCYSRKLWEIGMSSTNDADTIPATDDVLITGKIIEVLGGWEKINLINPNPEGYPDFPLYKPVNVEDNRRIVVDDPNIVKTCAAIILKQNYNSIEEREQQAKEIEYFFELYKKHKAMNKHYHVLFLAMSCNNPFFEMSRKVVHDTWAKDILNNAPKLEPFGNIGFYSYTVSTNGQSYIHDNCVYVADVQDDINHTYSKTIKALQILHDNDITWDIVVRTNTSTYINVKNSISLANKYSDGLLSFSIFDWPCMGEKVPLPAGWYMIMSNQFTDLLIEHFDELNEETKDVADLDKFMGSKNDDMLIGIFRHVINKRYGLNIPFYSLDPNKDVQHYKSFIENPFIQDPRERQGLYGYNQNTNPKKIELCLAMQVRLPGVQTRYRFIELEHMYELYNAEHNSLKNIE